MTMNMLSSILRHATFSVGSAEHRLIFNEVPRSNDAPQPQQPAEPQEGQPQQAPEKREGQKTPEAKQDATTRGETTSLFGEDPEKAADWSSKQYRQRNEYATLEASQNLQRVATSEQNKFEIVKSNPRLTPSTVEAYVRERNQELHGAGLHMSVTKGKVELSRHNTGPEDPRNAEIAKVKKELGAVNHQIWSINNRFRNAGARYAQLNRAKFDRRNSAPEITALAQRGSAEDAVAYERESRDLLSQKRALETRLDELIKDKQLNPAGAPANGPDQQRDTEPVFERPDRPDRGYALDDQGREGPDGQGGQKQERGRGGIMRNVPEESYPLSKESPDRVRAVMKAVERFNKAKTEEDQQIAEGAMRLLGVDVDASNLQSGRPEDVSITGKNDRMGNMIVGLFQWVGGWFKKLGGKKTSLENKNPKQKEVKDMTPEERAKEKELIGKSLEKNAKMTQESTGRIKELEQEKAKEGVTDEEKGKIDEKIGALKKDLEALKSERQALEARNKELGGSRKEAKDMTPDERATEKTDNEERVKENGEKLKKLTEDIGKLELEKAAERSLDPAELARLTALTKEYREIKEGYLKLSKEMRENPEEAQKNLPRINQDMAALKQRMEAANAASVPLLEKFSASNDKRAKITDKIASLQKEQAALTEENDSLEKRNTELDKAAAEQPEGVKAKGVEKVPAKESVPAAPSARGPEPAPANPAEMKDTAPAAPAKTETAPPPAPAAKEATPPPTQEPAKEPSTPQPEAKQSPAPPSPETVPEQPKGVMK